MLCIALVRSFPFHLSAFMCHFSPNGRCFYRLHQVHHWRQLRLRLWRRLFFGGLVAHRLLRSHELKSPLNISFMCEIRLIECFRSSRLCLKTIRFCARAIFWFDRLLHPSCLQEWPTPTSSTVCVFQRGGVRRHLLGRLQLSPYIWFWHCGWARAKSVIWWASSVSCPSRLHQPRREWKEALPSWKWRCSSVHWRVLWKARRRVRHGGSLCGLWKSGMALGWSTSIVGKSRDWTPHDDLHWVRTQTHGDFWSRWTTVKQSLMFYEEEEFDLTLSECRNLDDLTDAVMNNLSIDLGDSRSMWTASSRMISMKVFAVSFGKWTQTTMSSPSSKITLRKHHHRKVKWRTKWSIRSSLKTWLFPSKRSTFLFASRPLPDLVLWFCLTLMTFWMISKAWMFWVSLFLQKTFQLKLDGVISWPLWKPQRSSKSSRSWKLQVDLHPEVSDPNGDEWIAWACDARSETVQSCGLSSLASTLWVWDRQGWHQTSLSWREILIDDDDDDEWWRTFHCLRS